MALTSRRPWLPSTAALLLASLIVLAGCGGDDSDSRGSTSSCKPSGKPVTLTMWSWVPGIGKAVDIWNAENPDIQVKLKEVPGGNEGTYQNYNNALKAGRGVPDIGFIEYETLPVYRLQNALTDIGPCGAAKAEDQFVGSVWPFVTFGEDAVYAVPYDTGPMALYYRKDLFEKYGVAVPRTWEEFAAAARAVNKQDQSVHLTNVSSLGSNWFASLAWQAGARWLHVDGDTWEVSITDEATTRVADYWQGLIDDGGVSGVQSFTEEWNRALAKGKLLTWVSAAWGTQLIELGAPGTKGAWGVAPMPQWEEGEQASAPYGGGTYAVFNTSDHPYEATKFALWLNTDPGALRIANELGGGYPAARAGLELPALNGPQEFFDNERIYDVFREAAENVPEGWEWGPDMSTVYSTLTDGVGRAVGGSGTLQEAFQAAEDKMIEAMESQGLTVER